MQGSEAETSDADWSGKAATNEGLHVAQRRGPLIMQARPAAKAPSRKKCFPRASDPVRVTPRGGGMA